MDGVFPRRKILDIQGDFDALGRGSQSRGANALTLHILDVHSDGLGGGLRVTALHKNQTCGRQKQRGANGSSHDGSPSSDWYLEIGISQKNSGFNLAQERWRCNNFCSGSWLEAGRIPHACP
jgi:hypothetical protein